MTAGTSPSRASGVPKRAVSSAMTWSAHTARPKPPPSAAPWTAAITGAGKAATDRKRVAKRRASSRFSSSLAWPGFAHRLQVGAGAEDLPLSLEHHHPALLRRQGRQFLEEPRDSGNHFRRQRIARLRTPEAQPDDTVGGEIELKVRRTHETEKGAANPGDSGRSSGGIVARRAAGIRTRRCRSIPCARVFPCGSRSRLRVPPPPERPLQDEVEGPESGHLVADDRPPGDVPHPLADELPRSTARGATRSRRRSGRRSRCWPRPPCLRCGRAPPSRGVSRSGGGRCRRRWSGERLPGRRGWRVRRSGRPPRNAPSSSADDGFGSARRNPDHPDGGRDPVPGQRAPASSRPPRRSPGRLR